MKTPLEPVLSEVRPALAAVAAMAARKLAAAAARAGEPLEEIDCEASLHLQGEFRIELVRAIRKARQGEL